MVLRVEYARGAGFILIDFQNVILTLVKVIAAVHNYASCIARRVVAALSLRGLRFKTLREK